MLRIPALRFAASACALSALAGCAGSIGGEPPVAAVTGSVRASQYAEAAPTAPARPKHAVHPEMTPEAISAAAAGFSSCIEGLWPQAARRHISRKAFERYTADLTPDMSIMERVDAQPEFTKAIWDYLDVLVSDGRLEKGRELLAAYAPQFAAVERAYGVDRHVIAAIWGVESNYGTLGGKRPVLRSTATLACIGRRQKYFRAEFVAALEILARGDLRPDQLVGSWAGAFGPTQFMPSSFLRYAVDFNGDGRRDVVGTKADLFASTANHLKKAGWQSGRTWGYEVVAPRGFDYLLADRSRRLTLRQWEALGVRRANDRAFPHPEDRAYLLLPAGARGPAFLMLRNFRAIMGYNPAEAYALAIGHLADRLQGGGPFVRPWPRDQQVLSRSERLELQRRLERHGFDVGEPDGRLGSRTRLAIREFQVSAGLTPDGFASDRLLNRLRDL